MMDTLFLAFLAQHDDDSWSRLVDRLAQACHPVDRTALRIWFHLYPLALQHAMDAADAAGDVAVASGAASRLTTVSGSAALATRLKLEGRWRLSEQIDTSHRFFYGHRYWPQVKAGVLAYATRAAAPSSLELSAQIQEIARGIAAEVRRDAGELVAITAVGVRTLQQVGVEAFAAAAAAATAGVTPVDGGPSPEAVLAARARDDNQGLFGRFKGDRRKWTVTFDEQVPEDRLPLIHSQHLTTAAGMDPRDYRARDPRCTEGPIPVQCRSCSCGTCWVGVLGGAEKLSPVDERERAKLAECGYSDATDAGQDRPVMRLACMAQVYGAISIVIPPWNGQIGSLRKDER